MILLNRDEAASRSSLGGPASALVPGSGTPGAGAASVLGWAIRLLLSWCGTTLPGRSRTNLPETGPSDQQRPASTQALILSTLDFSTKLGPVRTGLPPPGISPLCLYCARKLTGREPCR